ncbi:hypothetical protein LAL4801_05105 [Roseibium aggregatum]|uniref:Uncharacterized protein n=1 Tax=Roseibium aggregatum TaxID=187304 RepID=A0A0M6Y972_9HYPH|nr:hypothetical protein LAL4801_05105 [Roseibium aggregatum]
MWLRSLRLWRCSSQPLIIDMNPSVGIDSNHSLDRCSEIFDTVLSQKYLRVTISGLCELRRLI